MIRTDVLVVGAGFSGATAARLVAEAGYRVHVIDRRAHVGGKAVGVKKSPEQLDVTASRSGDRVFLHVVNTSRTRSQTSRLAVEGMTIRSARVFEIATDPEFEVWAAVAGRLAPKQKSFDPQQPWTFPAASVSAIEMQCS